MPRAVKRPLVEAIMREQGICRAAAYVQVQAVRLPTPSPWNNAHHRRVRDEQLALIEAYLGRPLRAVASAAAVLLLLAVSASAQTVIATPTDLAVVWDPPMDRATGLADYVEYYLVKQGAQPGGTFATQRVDSGREYRFVPADPAKVYYFRVAACKVARVSGKDVEQCAQDSKEANTSAFVVTDPPVDACVGRYPSVFVTRPIESPTGRPGSLMLVLYQLASSTPVVKVEALVDGIAVATKAATGPGDSLTADAAIWFSTPATGRHSLAVRATNGADCARTGALLTPFVVK